MARWGLFLFTGGISHILHYRHYPTESLYSQGIVTITIAIGDALRRVPGGATAYGKFAIDGSDVVAGPEGIVTRGERGVWPRGGGEWFSITFRGNWGANPNDKPRVIDGAGKEMTVAGMTTGYSKDSAGNIGPGETTIEVFSGDPEKLDLVTFLLGQQPSLDKEPHIVTMQPKS